jgi:hypothetical protein
VVGGDRAERMRDGTHELFGSENGWERQSTFVAADIIGSASTYSGTGTRGNNAFYVDGWGGVLPGWRLPEPTGSAGPGSGCDGELAAASWPSHYAPIL